MPCSRRLFLAALARAPLSQSLLSAAERKVTAVYVKDMHCASCAKKIAGKLYTVPGVIKVSTDVKKGLAVIEPQPTQQPSPKAIWEAVEAVKFEPVKIASPLGTFTQKPRF